jgi:uncharacterized membrane protein
VSGVRGVHDVADQLERHHQPTDHPSLQGGATRDGSRPDALQERWAPSTRVAASIAGMLLVATAVYRRDRLSAPAIAIGGTLLGRAATDVPIARMLGLAPARRAVDLQKTITIDAPVADVYAFWLFFENFPHFMSRVLEVRPHSNIAGQSHWVVAGPAGRPVEFDAEITRAVPNQLLAWRSLPGSAVGHSGVVHFTPLGDARTRVHIRMSYQPPAGWLGHGVAALFGVDPKSTLDSDLARMKMTIETGRTPRDAAQPLNPSTAGH